jgi:hypothetical protein
MKPIKDLNLNLWSISGLVPERPQHKCKELLGIHDHENEGFKTLATYRQITQLKRFTGLKTSKTFQRTSVDLF